MNFSRLLGTKVHFDYPNLRTGFITAFIFENDEILCKNRKDTPDAIRKMQNYFQTDRIFEQLVQSCWQQTKEKGLQVNEDNLYFVVLDHTNLYKKNHQGYVSGLFTKDNIYASYEIMWDKNPLYRERYQKYNQLKHEYPKGSEIVLFNGQLKGCVGKVQNVETIKTQRNKEKQQVYIKLQEPKLKYMNKNILEKIVTKIQGQTKYFTLKDMLNLSTGTILFICGRFIITPNKNLKSAKGISNKFDIGLNFFNWRRDKKAVVPDFIRYIGTSGDNYGKALVKHRFELTESAINIIQKYQKAFPEIFEYIEMEIEKNKQSIFGLPRFKAEQIFQESEDCNVSLIHAYVWVIQNGEVDMRYRSMSSDIISRQYLTQMCDDINVQLQVQQFNIFNITTDYITDPNFICRKNYEFWLIPYYERHPAFHQLGDRVVQIKAQSKFSLPNFKKFLDQNSIAFGASGTIVGVLDHDIEIIFDNPFIGGSNLNGRCKWFHGAIVFFDEVFNLTRWDEYVIEREPRNSHFGWSGHINDYKPKYAEDSFGQSGDYILFEENLKRSKSNNQQKPRQNKHKKKKKSVKIIKRKKDKQQQSEQLNQDKQLNQELQKIEEKFINIENENQKQKKNFKRGDSVFSDDEPIKIESNQNQQIQQNVEQYNEVNQFEEISCKHCNEMLLQMNLQKHLTNYCEVYNVKCKGCNQLFPKDLIKEHLEKFCSMQNFKQDRNNQPKGKNKKQKNEKQMKIISRKRKKNKKRKEKKLEKYFDDDQEDDFENFNEDSQYQYKGKQGKQKYHHNQNNEGQRICFQFKKYGNCNYGDNCRFSHQISRKSKQQYKGKQKYQDQNNQRSKQQKEKYYDSNQVYEPVYKKKFNKRDKNQSFSSQSDSFDDYQHQDIDQSHNKNQGYYKKKSKKQRQYYNDQDNYYQQYDQKDKNYQSNQQYNKSRKNADKKQEKYGNEYYAQEYYLKQNKKDSQQQGNSQKNSNNNKKQKKRKSKKLNTKSKEFIPFFQKYDIDEQEQK